MTEKVYIAGPMRGIDKFNFPAFDTAAAYLRGWGYVVVNPAELDRAHGVVESSEVCDGLMRSCIIRDVLAICDGCTHLALLPGWEQSKGVAVELALAHFLGLEIIELLPSIF